MKKGKKPKPRKQDDPEQSRRFVEAARQLETDDSGKAFEDVLDRLSTRPSTPERRAKR